MTICETTTADHLEKRHQSSNGRRGQLFAREFLPARDGADDLQRDLLGDYKSNVALHPTFQKYSWVHNRRLFAIGAETIC